SGASDVTSAGRWPPNFVLVHSPECKNRGVKKVEAIMGTQPPVKGHPFGGGREYAKVGIDGCLSYGDEDGMETIASWECSPECPSKTLDGQSGFLKSGSLDRANIQSDNKVYGARPKNLSGVYEADSGTASRFFPQFTDTISPGLLDWLVKLICPEGGRVLTSEGLSYETNR